MGNKIKFLPLLRAESIEHQIQKEPEKLQHAARAFLRDVDMHRQIGGGCEFISSPIVYRRGSLITDENLQNGGKDYFSILKQFKFIIIQTFFQFRFFCSFESFHYND